MNGGGLIIRMKLLRLSADLRRSWTRSFSAGSLIANRSVPDSDYRVPLGTGVSDRGDVVEILAILTTWMEYGVLGDTFRLPGRYANWDT